MRHDHLFFSWLVRCGSEEQARGIRRNLEALPLTSIPLQDTARAFPGGSEIHRTQVHVLGDYFASIKMLPEPSLSSFQLLFERKPDAPLHWKDAMMHVLRMVRDGGIAKEPTPVQIVLKYRGDIYPPQQTEML